MVSGRPEMVGRSEELGRLESMLEAAMGGGGCAALIAGEPGMGKTRLLDEFEALVRLRGIAVIRGAAREEAAAPLAVFTDAFGASAPSFTSEQSVSFAEVMAIDSSGHLVARIGGAEGAGFAEMLSAVQGFVRDSFGGREAGLGRLEYGKKKVLVEHGGGLFLAAIVEGAENPGMRAALTEALRGIEEGGSVEKELKALAGAKFAVRRELEGVKLDNERLRVAEHVLTELSRASEPSGAVLMLEDIHWADETSLFALLHLARNAAGARAFVLGTFRPGENHGLDAAAEGLVDLGNASLIHLERLGADAVQSLVSVAYPSNTFADGFVMRLTKECGGNPLFVLELLSQMETEGRIRRQGDAYVLAGEDYTIPGSVEAVVGRRLEALDSESLAMAEYASCAGRAFRQSDVLSIRSIQDPGGALERLASAGIVIVDGATGRFSHALFQEAVYRGMSATWRASNHRTLGEHIEATSADTGAVVYELARHFGRGEGRAKSLKYNVMAGEKAEAALAADLAVGFYATALEATKARAAAADGAARAAELRERIGDLESLLGRFDEAVASYAGAMAGGGGAETEARLRRKTGLLHHKRGKMAQAMAEFETAMTLLGDGESLEAARVVGAIGLVQEGKGDFALALQTQERAAAIYGRCGAPAKDLAVVVTRIGACHHQMGDFDEALIQYERALELGRNADDPLRVASAMNNIGIIHAVRGDYNAALACGEQSLEIRKKSGDVYALGLVHNNIGVIMADLEDFGGAERHYREYLAIARRLGDIWGEGCALNNIGTMLTNKGDNDAAVEYQREALKLLEKVGDRSTLTYCRIGIGHALLEKGDLDGAEDNFSKALALAKDTGNREVEGRVMRMMADVSAGRSDWALAGERYAVAMRLTNETGATRTVPEVLMAHGVMLKAKGDLAGARVKLEEARNLYAGMGLKRSADRAEKHLSGL